MSRLKTNSQNSIRKDWADVAKALSIILVVLHHSIIKNPAHPGYNEVILHVNNSLVLFMLPMFFFVSGVFAKSIINSDINTFLNKRVLPLFFLYILWSFFKYVLKDFLPALLLKSDQDIYSIFYILTDPLAELWFIYALLLYFIFTRLTLKIKPSIIIVFALSVFLIFSENGQIFGLEFFNRLARFFICFYAGYLLQQHIEPIRVKISSLSILLVPVLIFALYHFIGGRSYIDPRLMIVLIFVNISFGILVSEIISRTFAGQFFSFVGKHTLPIYLFHYIPIYLFHYIPITIVHKLEMNAKLDPIIFVITTVALAVFSSILVYKIASRVHLNWIYVYPEKLKIKERIRSSLAKG